MYTMTYKGKYKNTTTTFTQDEDRNWLRLANDGTWKKTARNSFTLTKMIYDTTAKCAKAEAEEFIKAKTSDTDYLVWVSLYEQRCRVFKGGQHQWKQIKNLRCCTGDLANGQGSITSVSFKKTTKIYDKQKAFEGPHGMQYNNQHFTSKTGNSFHTRVGAGKKDGNRKPLTHGCVGLKGGTGKGSDWFFNNVPIGTRVIVW